MEKRNSVLIVDDQRENLDNLKSILEDKYDIYTALNGALALKVMNKVDIDLVLLDLVMPVMDGFETVVEMRRIPKLVNLPVIFITAAEDSFNEEKGLILGAMDYIKKPYNPSIVSIKVKNQIENKMYRDNLEQLVAIRTQEIVETRDAIIMSMSIMAEGRDGETGLHIDQVKDYVQLLAEEIIKNHPELLTEAEAARMILMSPLHDVGKVTVSDTILLKPGRLTEEEFELMKSHTSSGAKLLRETERKYNKKDDFLKYGIEMSELHHEKYDGSGYPYGLKGDEIPLSACICAMADIYSALTTKRPYKEPFSHEKACDIIINGDGRVKPEHFNPVVLAAFINIKDKMNDHRIELIRQAGTND